MRDEFPTDLRAAGLENQSSRKIGEDGSSLRNERSLRHGSGCAALISLQKSLTNARQVIFCAQARDPFQVEKVEYEVSLVRARMRQVLYRRAGSV